MKAWLRNDPHARPLIILAACILLLTAADRGHGRFLSMATPFSTMETFANGGMVALGLGLTMMIREFDLSVVGIFGLAGCVAVMAGQAHPWLGIACAIAIGLAAGIIQGLIIVRFALSSVGVTLGGLLVCVGVAYVLTQSQSIPYNNLSVALSINARIAGIFSPRSIVTLFLFVAAAAVVGFTRIGRDLIAIGSDRRAAAIAGVDVNAFIVGVFAFSGFCAALCGALLSYSLASASPAGLSDVLVPAAAAAILGGVSLGGGSGRPLGIAIGVIILAVLHSGLNAIEAPPYVNDIAMGIILLTVAILDGPYLSRRLKLIGRRAHAHD